MNTDVLIYSGAILTGLLFLYFGGESLIRGASNLAISLGIKPILIALTVVAFGTSMPEAVVSFLASIQSKPDIAVANVIGSNIFNLAFILGISALIRPLKVEADSIKREIPFLVGSVIVLFALGIDGELGRIDGVLLLILLGFFLVVCFKKASSDDPTQPESNIGHPGKAFNFFLVLIGLSLMILGGQFLIYGSVAIAKIFHVSDLIIGLTIVAAGTSLPELVTSTLSAYRGKDDFAIGNVTGSNIFNIFFILGLCAVFFPLNVSPIIIQRDIPVLFLISIICLPLMRTGFRISRMEGFVLVLCYLGYVVFFLIPHA